MSKIKITLSSGNTVEKPLVTCFRGTNGDYLVLDNETNGSMGLPIICISKFNGTKAEKIIDQAEWASVKDNLKTIIAGTNLKYLSVPDSLTASDDFYTQLTLPVASFDLLKNVYKPEVTSEPVTAPTMPVQPAVEPSVPEMPAVPEMPFVPDATVIAPIETPSIPTPEVVETPTVVPEAPVMPEIPAAEVAIPTPTVTATDDIEAIKANFMKSCETMFDALIKKFENK